MKQIKGAKLYLERAKNVIETYKTYQNRSSSMVFEAVLSLVYMHNIHPGANIHPRVNLHLGCILVI